MSDHQGAPEAPGAAEAEPPARRHIPYGRQWIDDEDVDAVVEVLRSDWLTTGPGGDRFEAGGGEFVGSGPAACDCSATTASPPTTASASSRARGSTRWSTSVTTTASTTSSARSASAS